MNWTGIEDIALVAKIAGAVIVIAIIAVLVYNAWDNYSFKKSLK